MARTIGVKYKNLIKRLVIAENDKGIVNLTSSFQSIIDQLPDAIWETWESAGSEIERLVSDGITEAYYSNRATKTEISGIF